MLPLAPQPRDLSPSGVPLTAAGELVKLYREAQDKLKAIVLHPPGKTAKAQSFNSARAAEQLRQIEKILRGLKADSQSWIGTFLPVAFTDGIRRAEQQAAAVGVRPKEAATYGSFNLIDKGTVSIFARDITRDLNHAADALAERAAKLLRQTRQMGLSENEIDRILAGGVITGQPVATIRLLRDELKRIHGDEVAVKTKSGGTMNFEVGYYASMVARTKTRQATVAARHHRLEQLGLDLVAIVGRVSKNFCTAYLGQVFSLNGKSTKYPPLSSLPSHGPPFHPNCTKSTRPFVEDLASQKQLDDAEGDEDSDKLLNVDAQTAQKRYKDLQVQPRVKERYASTAELFAHA